MHFSVAVDGPSSVGKGTAVKAIANKFGLRCVDTGATLRMVALKVIKNGLCTKIKDDVLSILDKLDMHIDYDNECQLNYLDGKIVNDDIRSPEVSMGSSDVSVIPEVRIKLAEIWRKIADENDVIMEGRDIGTYVLPNANLKIYMTASVKERSNRRYKEMKNKGYDITYEEIKKSIEERDYQDSNRAFSPALKAEDAIIIDTTDMTINEVVDKMSILIEKAKLEG